MSDELPILSGLTDADLENLLHRAIRNTLILGGIASLVVWIAASWRDAAMLATGTAISAASLTEWRRLARLIAAKIENKQAPPGAAFAILFFVLRLTIFAGAIYVSLRFLRGSAVALLCGLALAVLTLVWEALRLLRN
ncbi:MAG: hypothetical protein WBP85_08255 [Terracidiphilus sp.]